MKFKNGGGGGAMMRELSPPGNGAQRNKGPQMDPPEPAQLVATLGGNSLGQHARSDRSRAGAVALRADAGKPGVHDALASRQGKEKWSANAETIDM